MSFDIDSVLEQLDNEGPDLTQASKGGGGYVPPAEGLCRLRYIGYIESGAEWNEKFGKMKYGVRHVFELSGPKHEPKVLDDGTKIPHRITVYGNGGTNYGALNEKANDFKLFKLMNWKGDAKHFAKLVGREYLGTVYHEKREDGSIKAGLRDPAGGFSIRSHHHQDAITGDTVIVPVDPPITKPSLFLHNFPSLAMWDSLYIDGEYEAQEEEKDDTGKVTRKARPARSKNVVQEQIMSGKTWEGSPMHQLLVARNAGGEVKTPDAETPKAGPDADPLNDI